jgi:diguanylate cyclase (GGDEF)-like protein
VKCHGFLGFKDGDLRGGVSVSIPLTPYFEAAAITSRGMWITHSIVWLLALFSITLFTYFARSRQQERIKLLKKLEHDAVHDGLTNLPNRLLFTDRLEHAINRSTRESGYQFAVCFLDLDRFKNINDSYGHQVGDNLLIKVAERLSHVLRPADSVARIGGDEFTFLLDDIEGLREAVFISERILSSLTSPFVTDIGELYVNASIGVCLSNNVYSKAEDMLRDADIALYRAKDSGRGRVDIFNKDMHEKAKQVMQMENDLRFAIEKKQFEVYYQPVVDISKNCIYGYEALLRWKHPELGFISPEIFIPVAEDTGLINDIGSWVMKQACSSVRDWNLEFGNSHPFCLAVNLSGKQLVQTDIVENIKNILMDTRFNPKLLHCEVTETAVIINREKSGKVIDELQEMGIEISVDDFGKGYSSLTYLHEFDFDTLKIDKDFVQDMGEKGKGRQLVKTMMLLARDFEMNLIAEGVEESDQLNRLKAMGCKFIQGYYFSKPLPAGEIHKLLQQGCHKNADKMVISPESDIESIKAI